MRVAHRETGPRLGGFAHRPGGIRFISLLSGEAGAKDNFEFCLVLNEEDYYTPQHHHNFDQVRVMLEGVFGYAKDTVQEAGTIGYFSEGTRYVQFGRGAAEMLLLQCSGASHSNYLSLADLKEVTEDLATNGKGEFVDGVYTYVDEDGKKHNKDGWEAAWEYKFQQPVVYPKSRYESPVIMNPDNYQWLQSGEPGVEVRHLGSFNERQLALGQLRLSSGSSFALPVTGSRRLLFVYEGEGSFNDESVTRHSAAFIDANEAVEIKAQEDLFLLSICLPRYDAGSAVL